MLGHLTTLELRANKLVSTAGLGLPTLKFLFLVSIHYLFFCTLAGSGVLGVIPKASHSHTLSTFIVFQVLQAAKMA